MWQWAAILVFVVTSTAVLIPSTIQAGEGQQTSAFRDQKRVHLTNGKSVTGTILLSGLRGIAIIVDEQEQFIPRSTIVRVETIKGSRETVTLNLVPRGGYLVADGEGERRRKPPAAPKRKPYDPKPLREAKDYLAKIKDKKSASWTSTQKRLRRRIDKLQAEAEAERRRNLPRGFNRGTFNVIKVGTPQADVKLMLGEPDSYSSSETKGMKVVVWLYDEILNGKLTRFTFSFFKGVVFSKSETAVTRRIPE